MTIQELFIRSNEALLKSVMHISEDQWSLDMPPGTSSKPMTLRQAIQYHTYDDAWVPDVLAGKNTEAVGTAYDFLLVNNDVLENYQKYNALANQAVLGFQELERVTHLSYGDFPARDYLQHIISFRAFRAYDIAKLTGADTTMDSDLVQALLDEFTPVIESYRQMGVFPAAIKVADDASPQTRLMAMVGRE